MQREIKFRVWYKDKMCLPEGIQSYSDFMVSAFGGVFFMNEPGYHNGKDHSAVLMQYTGLKDKNGREIYEGDIIRFDEKNIGFIDCEDWLEFFVHWIGEPDCTDYARDFYRIGRSEVIGNVHENPELL